MRKANELPPPPPLNAKRLAWHIHANNNHINTVALPVGVVLIAALVIALTIIIALGAY